MSESVYNQLATHLSALGMGYPPREELLDILKESFTPREAEVALAIPTRVIPFQLAELSEIAAGLDVPRAEVAETLENLAGRGLIFSRRMENGERGYALQQFGYGFPQTYFWKGANTPFSRRMAELVARYSGKEQIRSAYGATETKALRYVPPSRAFQPEEHAVFPFEMMEELIGQVRVIALAHCPCRVSAELLGKRLCSHELETCIKYDDLAEYLIERGLGRQISRNEAMEVVRRSEEAGLVHLVDNAYL